MKNYGFIRVAAASPKIRLADMAANAAEICRMIEEAAENEVSIIVFPEMSLMGTTCGDMLLRSSIMDQTRSTIEDIAAKTAELDITAVIGGPSAEGQHMESCAYVISGGEVWGSVCESEPWPHWFKVGDARMAVVFGNDSLHPASAAIESVLAGADLWPISPASRRFQENTPDSRIWSASNPDVCMPATSMPHRASGNPPATTFSPEIV